MVKTRLWCVLEIFKMKKERRIINSFIQQITGDENFIYLKN